MPYPKNLFSAKPYDAQRLLLEIIAQDGTWQLMVEKEQARILGAQLLALSEGDTVSQVSYFLQNSMVYVPGSTLWMGSMPGENVPSDELPRHPVQVSELYVSALLVTQGLYRYVMGENPSIEKGSKKPVHAVSWIDALHFCNALSTLDNKDPVYTLTPEGVVWDRSANGYRLPTEAEWEYVARTKDDLFFSGSDSMDDVAWCLENSTELADVGVKQPNAWGIYDLSGLVCEWCWDGFGAYPSDNSSNLGSLEGEKVCRGGSWQKEKRYAKPTSRYTQIPTFQGDVGIRLLRNV